MAAARGFAWENPASFAVMPRDESMHSLRSAFLHEVRPDDYLLRAALTALAAMVALSGIAGIHDGVLYVDSLIPVGQWQPRNPAGVLYIELWTNITVNGFQFGFALWGALLLLLGLVKALTARRVVTTSFTLGTAFLALAYFLPLLAQLGAQALIERYPFLIE